MNNNKKIKIIFFILPIGLIASVFLVTYMFSFYLDPVLLSIPLMAAYYIYVWCSIDFYRRRVRGKDSLFKADEFKRGYSGLSLWMYLWTVAYPLIIGTSIFIYLLPHIPWFWLIPGIFFAMINGPSEEIFWRLLMERIGTDAGLGKNTRLYYSSAVFSLWHFIFVVFLFPEKIIFHTLVSVHIITFIAGLLWMMVYQKTKNILPDILSHAYLNFFYIWPWTVCSILGLGPINDFFK